MTESSLRSQYYYLRQTHQDYPEKAFRLTTDEKKQIYFWDSYLIDPFVIFGGKDKIKEKGFIKSFATLCKKGFDQAKEGRSFDLRNLYHLGMKHEIMNLEEKGIDPQRQHRFILDTRNHEKGAKLEKHYSTELFNAPPPVIALEKFSEDDMDGILDDSPKVGQFSYEFRQTGTFSPELKEQVLNYIHLETILNKTGIMNGHQKTLAAQKKDDNLISFICFGLTNSFDMNVGFQVQKYNIPVLLSDAFHNPQSPYSAFASGSDVWHPIQLNYSRVLDKPIAAGNMMQVLECDDTATETKEGIPFFKKIELQEFADFLNRHSDWRITKTAGAQLKDKHFKL